MPQLEVIVRPPFESGTPEAALPAIVEQLQTSVAEMTARREATARRVGVRHGIHPPDPS